MAQELQNKPAATHAEGEPETVDQSIEIRSAFRAYVKAPHKAENRKALIKVMDAYETSEFDRRLAALKAEFGKS